jgi:hypothetical protein
VTPAWLPIRYRDFYDVPRAVVVEFRGHMYLLDCLFDHDIDDYEAEYTVYRLPDDFADSIEMMSWTDLGHHGTRVGALEVSKVVFDPTKRGAISDDMFQLLGLE